MTSRDIKTGPPMDRSSTKKMEETAELDRQDLLRPEILESGLSTLVDRYGTRTSSGECMTPDIKINAENTDTDGITVFASTTELSNSRTGVIYQKNDNGQPAEWIVFGRLPDGMTTVRDGSGRQLDDEADRTYVRAILEAMKTGYEQDITRTTDSFDIREHLMGTLQGKAAALKAELDSLQSLLDTLDECPEPPTAFRVTIESAWRQEGEHSLEGETFTADSLSEAIRQAIERFKELNNRNDVQASSFQVDIPTADGHFSGVPDAVVAPLFQALSCYDLEDANIRRARQKRANQ